MDKLDWSKAITCFLYEELKHYIALLDDEKKSHLINGNGGKAESVTNLFFGSQALLRRPSQIWNRIDNNQTTFLTIL